MNMDDQVLDQLNESLYVDAATDIRIVDIRDVSILPDSDDDATVYSTVLFEVRDVIPEGITTESGHDASGLSYTAHGVLSVTYILRREEGVWRADRPDDAEPMQPEMDFTFDADTLSADVQSELVDLLYNPPFNPDLQAFYSVSGRDQLKLERPLTVTDRPDLF